MKTRDLILACMLGGLVNTASASGFGISGKSASNLGNAFSGTAVQAEDASVVYTNPSAMQYMEGKHVSVLVHYIGSDLRFKDEGSNVSGPSRSSVTDPHFVPNLYYVNQLGQDARFGLGIYAPYGLGLGYDSDWKGRYVTTGSDMKIINFSPNLSFKASEKLNIGVGVDLQYLEARLENAVDFGLLLGSPGSADGSQKLTGKNWAIGYSMGLSYDLDETTRLGLSFHSSTRHDIDGKSDFSDVPAPLQPVFADTNAALTLVLPESLSLGVGHTVSPKLQLMADATWTRWSRYEELVIEFENPLLPSAREEQNWHDTWRLSVGGNYRLNERWLLRGGISHDATPIPDAEHRSPRVPGTTRNWVSVGSNVQFDKAFDLDLALSYTLPVTTKIDNTDSAGHNLKGEYESEILYLTVQLNWQL